MRGYVPDCWKWIPALAASALIGLSGCSETPQKPREEQVISSSTRTTEVRQDNSNLFQQANAALQKRDFATARPLLLQLQQQTLSDKERIDWLLLSGVMELGSNNADAASQHLRDLVRLRKQASKSQDQRISLLQAAWYEQKGEYFAAARERVWIAASLKDDAYTQNHNSIWQDLQQIPTAELHDKARQNHGSVLGQWLELASISRSGGISLDDQAVAIEEWQKMNTGHPAAQLMPGSLTGLSNVEQPTRVAIALPLSGPLERVGVAIRDGFMAAYQDALNKGHTVPELIILDTQTYPTLDEIYAAASLQGAEWLVGPINKAEVQQLESRQQLPIPTLALNYGDITPQADAQPRPANLWEFGLAPEDQGIQVAERAWADGRRQALVMAPRDEWSERVVSSFRERWLALGGTIAETMLYTNHNDYNPDMRALLQIDDSEVRANRMRQIAQQEAYVEPTRRSDADWLFLVAQPQQARLIKPALAFNYAGDLPVYSTSHIYSGVNDINNDRDLDGIQFCDLPWLLEQGDLYRTVENTTPSGQGRFVRLYALGVDAFQLIPRLPRMRAFEGARVSGVTGELRLDSRNRVRREESCTRFNNGAPVLLRH